MDLGVRERLVLLRERWRVLVWDEGHGEGLFCQYTSDDLSTGWCAIGSVIV